MDKRLYLTVGCLAIFALVTPAEAARVNVGDHPLASAPGQLDRGQSDWLILAGGDGGDGGNSSTNEVAGEIRGDIAAATKAVQSSSLAKGKKDQLLAMLNTGKSTVNSCSMESNMRAARKCFKKAGDIVNVVMDIVEAEG